MARDYRGGRSVFGPILLIGIGVLLLLAMQHVISLSRIGYWFARYWPVLLIAAGVIRLFEFLWAKQSDRPAPRFGGGSIALVILLIIFGYGITSAHHFSQEINWNNGDVDMDGPWADAFRGDPHEFDLRQDLPMNGNSLDFHANRADITVAPSPDDKVHVLTHLTVYSHSESDADSIRNKFKVDAAANAAGTVITMGALENGKASFTIQVPEKATLDLTNERGDITVRDRKAAVTINTQRGDVIAEDIGGMLTVHSGGRSSVTAHQVQGDVSVQGKFGDIIASDLTGAISLEGDFYGEVRFSKIAKGVHFHSARTEMEFGKIEGEMNMTTGELQATSVAGPVRVVTRSKDLHLQQVSGDVDLEDENASIELQPQMPLGAIRVQNKRGSIEFVAPDNSNFVLQARADGGEISSDLPGVEAQSTDHGDSTASGTVGKGGSRIILTADKGSINLRKQ